MHMCFPAHKQHEHGCDEMVTGTSLHYKMNPASVTASVLCRWRLGAQSACLIVEDADQGLLGAWSSRQEVQQLVAALDRRGERELALANELTKVSHKEMPLAKLLPCEGRKLTFLAAAPRWNVVWHVSWGSASVRCKNGWVP